MEEGQGEHKRFLQFEDALWPAQGGEEFVPGTEAEGVCGWRAYLG